MGRRRLLLRTRSKAPDEETTAGFRHELQLDGAKYYVIEYSSCVTGVLQFGKLGADGGMMKGTRSSRR